MKQQLREELREIKGNEGKGRGEERRDRNGRREWDLLMIFDSMCN